MAVVVGIQKPEGAAPSVPQAATSPVRDGAFAKELTKRVAAPATSNVVAATRTHLSGQEAASAIEAAWRERFGEAPPKGALEVLVADWAHETGGGRAMMNYNFGGLKGKAPSGLSAAYLTTEGSGAAASKVVDHFRAYRSAAEGAADYVGLLAQRFPKALDAARGGNAAGFVAALKQGGYFTDSGESYTRSVVALANRAQALGFDALGASSNAAHASSQITTPAIPADAPSAPSPMVAAQLSTLTPAVTSLGALTRANSLAMADELSRAALRIAASEPARTDEDA
jgi:flagellar protein FlgJ